MRIPFSAADLNVALVGFCRCGLHLAFGSLPGAPDPREAAAAHFDRLAVAACRRRFAAYADGPESPRVTVAASHLDAYARDVEPEAVRSALAAYLALWRRAGARGAALPEDRELRRLALATADALLPGGYR